MPLLLGVVETPPGTPLSELEQVTPHELTWPHLGVQPEAEAQA